MLQDFLAGGRVDAAVFALRPDYRAMLLAVDGLVPGPSDQASDVLLAVAEAAVRDALFILDALDPVTDQALYAAADDLAAHLVRLGPRVRAARRLIAPGPDAVPYDRTTRRVDIASS
jgi:hypothetical protein